MKCSSLLPLGLFCALQAFAQNGEPTADMVRKPAAEVTALIAGAYARNEVTSTADPYHFVASFETFTADGLPDGHGMIQRWAASPLRTKTVTTFHDHTMTEYFNNGPSLYTDDGFVGNIMSYFASVSLFYAAIPPTGILKRVVEPSLLSLDGDVLDCGAFVSEFGPPAYPAPPSEHFCVSRNTGDLVLQKTENVTFRYQDFAPFLDKSIARTIVGSKDRQVRFRIKIEQLDQATVGDTLMDPPASASLTPSKPNRFATENGETTPTKTPKLPVPPELKAIHAAGQVVLYVLISRAGTVIDVEPIFASTPELARYAMELARLRVYKPILRHGKSIEDIVHAYFDFAF